MLPNDWEKINELFHHALELPQAEREGFLRENCADESVRAEISELLAAQENDSDFLRSPVFETGLEFIAAPETLGGERIGAYQIIGELGRGGMGAVYQAFRADGAFERRVAIKLLPKNNLSDALAQKFRRERQILAHLNHPFIARLFDGGEMRDGTPYFVMELVRGATVTDFCRKQQLPIDERLKLFTKICEAVEYAHANGIVHRDLKPSNILIDENGEPKLLDFGIAKLLENDAGGDATSGFSFLTPEYASPEQVSGRQITAQTDVYSLGVILYELLTDARPYNFENRSPAGISSVICDSEPPKPSTVKNRQNTRNDSEVQSPKSKVQSPKTNGSIDVDLDLIVLKALRKDAARRYESVAEFAEDIERLTKGLPVKAAPDKIVYRTTKFFRRHQFSMSASIVAGLLLIISAPLIYWNFHAKSSTRQDGARRLTDNQAANDYPHFAPGNQVIFTRTSENSERLFVIDTNGGGEKLLNENLHADRAVFSPDGKQIAFRSTDDYRIYVANSDFSGLHKLTRGRGGRPAWFPDSKRLLFSYNFSQNLDETAQPLYENRDNVEIFSVNADGSDETNLTNNPAFDSDACASPDGKQIAFASDRDGAYEIYTMNADGSQIRRLTRNEFEDTKPAFSPDGKLIAFTSKRDGNEEIYLMNIDGTNVRRVTNALGDDREPQFSPDGKSIVFAADGAGNRQLYIIDTPAD